MICTDSIAEEIGLNSVTEGEGVELKEDRAKMSTEDLQRV